jgi:arylsulfatase A-like enzyme
VQASFPDPHHPFCAAAPYSEMYDPQAVTLPDTWAETEDLCEVLAGMRGRTQGYLDEHDEQRLRLATAQSYGMIRHVDACVGRILDHLEATGLAENTVVAFFADHGEFLGAHHLLFKGGWPYDAVQRIPFIWRAPDACRGDVRSDVVSIVDLAPTVLDYAGLDVSVLETRPTPSGALPGDSLRSALRGECVASRAALVQFDAQRGVEDMVRLRGLITDRYKLTLYAHTGEGVLIDLQEDPHERRNLWNDPAAATTKAELLSQLCDELAWNDRRDGRRWCNA